MKTRLRWIFWVTLVLAVTWWQIRSNMIGDAYGGSVGGSAAVEIVSWKGKASVNLSWPGTATVPWHYWTIPMERGWNEYLGMIQKIGIRQIKVPVDAWIICWPIPLPLVLAFLAIEIPSLVRRFRRKRKVDAGPDAGIADDHE